MFWSGLIVGLIVGIVATLGVLAYMLRDFKAF